MTSKPSELSHIDRQGQANMVDVSTKPVTHRLARATATVCMQAETADAIRTNKIAKGEVIAVARIAGIQAAKQCAQLIPLCHPLMLSKIDVEFSLESDRLIIDTMCKVTGQTGVEMEALTAASVAALTIFDMCKAIDKGMTIENLCILEKSGGKSGLWQRTETDASLESSQEKLS